MSQKTGSPKTATTGGKKHWKPHYEWKYERVVLTKKQAASMRFQPDSRYIFFMDMGWVGIDDLFSFLESGFKKDATIPVCELHRLSDIYRQELLNDDFSFDTKPTFSSVEDCLNAIQQHEKLLSELRKEFPNFSSK